MAKRRSVTVVCLTIDHVPGVPSDLVKCGRCGARCWRTKAEPNTHVMCFACCFKAIRAGEVSAKDFAVSPAILRETCRELGLEPREVRDIAALIGKAAERYARRAH